MKQIVRYNTLTISNKLRCELRIIVDDKTKYVSNNPEHGMNTSITLHPILAINITRQSIVGDDGTFTRPTWNPNDTLVMTKYNVPLFIHELDGIYTDMSIKNLYTYTDKRLELNSGVANKIKRSFMLGNAAVEMIPCVIELDDDSIVEGIKLMFNVETSVLYLTLNDMIALLHSMKTMSIDELALIMYNGFITKGVSNNG